MTTSRPFDPTPFHHFEHHGWEQAAAFYGDAFGGLTAQAAEPLLDAVGVPPAVDLLDVAAGPGFVAAAAHARGATVVGLDFSAAMIAEATRRHPAIAFREGDAQALPFDDDRFDAVVMNFGLLHLARPEAAIAEARRVLRPGGRYGFTVWGVPEQAVGFGLAVRAIEEFGRPDVGLPEGPPFFRFSDAAECRATLEAAGFIETTARLLPLTWRLESADELFAALSRGGVRTAAVLRAQTPDALENIRAAVRRGIEPYAQGAAFVVPMTAVLACGTKAALA